MLFGLWKESKPDASENKEWVVELPDDAASPLEIVLPIIHGKFDSVPACPTLETIHQVLVIANKYDMTGIAKPWCKNWLAEADQDELVARDTVRSLYIAWELGDEHLFARRLEEIAVKSWLDSNGSLVYGKKIVLHDEDYLGPQTSVGKLILDWYHERLPGLY